MKTDLSGVHRGAKHRISFPSHHLQAPQPLSVTQTHDSLASSCSLLPRWVRSPTVLNNAKIMFLLPMKIMSEPSTLPCLVQKAAPQGRGGPGCSYGLIKTPNETPRGDQPLPGQLGKMHHRSRYQVWGKGFQSTRPRREGLGPAASSPNVP